MASGESAYRELKPMPQQDLHACWALVKEGLKEVKEHSTQDWIAEDIYSAIRANSSWLYLGLVQHAYVGFCVLTPTVGYACKMLHVWCVYNATDLDVIALFADELEKIARSIGARKITFLSPRPGWERRLKGYGFRPGDTLYEKDVK